MKCDRCGIDSPVEEAFRPVSRLFKKPWRYCPLCANQRQRRDITQGSLFVAGLLALLVAMGFGLEPPGPKRNEMLLLPLCALCYPLDVVLHELAHAAAAAAMGLRVFNILIGFRGISVWRRTLSGTEIQLKSLPIDGLTLLAPRSLTLYRLRFGVAVAAGPLMNGLLAAGAYLFPRTSTEMSLGASALFWSNLFLFSLALFPWRHATPHGIVASDGLALLSLPFRAQDKVAERRAAYFALEGTQCVRQKKYEAAVDWARRGLREYPNQVAILSVLGLAQLGLDQLFAARDTFAAGLEAAGSKQAHRAIFLTHVAGADLWIEDGALLEEADRYSEEAMRLAPWVPGIRGTRGNVLVKLGRLDEGIDLLTSALKDNEDKASRATNTACLAIALAKKGDSAGSRRYLEQAKRLDSDCSLLPRVRRELSLLEAQA